MGQLKKTFANYFPLIISGSCIICDVQGDTHMSDTCPSQQTPFLSCHLPDDPLFKPYQLRPPPPLTVCFIPDDPIFWLFSAARPFKFSHALLQKWHFICFDSFFTFFIQIFPVWQILRQMVPILWISTPMTPWPFCFKLCTEWPPFISKYILHVWALFLFWVVYWVSE